MPFTRELALQTLAIWTTFGLFESLQAYASQPSRGIPRSLFWALARNMPWWWVWALLTPIVWAIVQRYPIARQKLWTHLPLHGAVSVGVAVLQMLLASVVLFPTSPPSSPFTSPLALFGSYLDAFLPSNLVTYWGVVAVVHAVTFRRTIRERDLQAERLNARAAQLERAVASARLDALRMQLHPHFLFNTLNSVSGMIRTGDRDGAVEMLAQLGDLLRTTLGKNTAPIITLDEEIGFLSRYLAIESIRFRDRLQVSYQVEEEERRCQVPSLILQPLVENAVKHGIAREPGGGAISIRATRDGATLQLIVENTSLTPTHTPPPRVGSGLGLQNTRARLRELYGDDAQLQTEFVPNGFRATVQIPYAKVFEVPHVR